MRRLLRTLPGSITPKENKLSHKHCVKRYWEPYNLANSLALVNCSEPSVPICFAL